MGQALQKLRGVGAGAGGAGGAVARSREHVSHGVDSVRVSPSPRTVRQSVEVRPEAPEPQRIIEPELIKGEWDRGDPKYSMMVQQVMGKISTRPGGEQEMGSAHVAAEFRRPKPVNRHTVAASGADEKKNVVAAAGTLDIGKIQEALRLYQGLCEGHEKGPVDVKTLAVNFNVDVVLLEKVLHHTSLPVSSQKPQTPPAQNLRV